MNEENKTLASIKDLTELEEYADLAYNFLHGKSEIENNEYSNDKEIIQTLFSKDSYSFTDIKLQLLVIDSVYSTNVNSKNNDAIKEITEKIFDTFEVKLNENIDKEEIVGELKDFLNENFSDNKFQQILNNIYGFQKLKFKDNCGVHAPSLISKYCYFITKYQFPIYDSFVKKNYEVLKNNDNIKSIEKPIGVKVDDLVKKINVLTESIWGVKGNYEKLDNLMWIIGKIRNGGFPLLLGKRKYYELMTFLSENNEFVKLTRFDKDKGKEVSNSNLFKSTSFNKTKFTKIIISKLDNISVDIISKDLKELIKFSSF